MLHVGPYADEPVSMQKIEKFSTARGLAASGKHHEIYMSDPRRVKQENMKTILRHAVKRNNTV
jgi:hypothetical protein